jgi:transcriptional regulator with XRE-family HTH domain
LSETQHIAEALRRLRRIRGLSQADLAERAGLSSATISEIESAKRGSVRPSTLRKLADVLGVSVAYFFAVEVPEPPKAPSPSLVREILRDGLGHSFCTEALRDTVAWAHRSNVNEIMVRMYDLGDEAIFLRDVFLRPAEYAPEAVSDPVARAAVWSAIRDAWANARVLLATLEDVAEQKIEAVMLEADEIEEETRKLHRDARRALDTVELASHVVEES